jgi:hypothetical protein
MKTQYFIFIGILLVLSISLTFNIKHYIESDDNITLKTKTPSLKTRIHLYRTGHWEECDKKFHEDNETFHECLDAGEKIIKDYFGDRYIK